MRKQFFEQLFRTIRFTLLRILGSGGLDLGSRPQALHLETQPLLVRSRRSEWISTRYICTAMGHGERKWCRRRGGVERRCQALSSLRLGGLQVRGRLGNFYWIYCLLALL